MPIVQAIDDDLWFVNELAAIQVDSHNMGYITWQFAIATNTLQVWKF